MPTDPRSAVIRTLLLTDLVGSTRLVERLGDQRANEVSQRHDRMARDLLVRFGGREIDKTDGFLLLFGRPYDAVKYALRYHEALAELSAEMGVELEARAGLHIGEVFLRENSAEDVARGAKPLEVEGLAKPMAARIMSLAMGRQTLMTRGTFDLAQRAAIGSSVVQLDVEWLSHGPYQFKGVNEPIGVYEVGVRGVAPLAPPPDTEKARRVVITRDGAVKLRLSRKELAARRRARRLRLAAAVLLPLLVVALVYWQRQSAARLPVEGRPTVAVLGLAAPADGPDLDWQPAAVAELVAFDLEASDALDLVPPAALDGGLPPPPASGDFDPPQLARIRQDTGAGVAVYGRLEGSDGGGEILVDLRVQDTASGRPVQLPPEKGGEGELVAMTERLSARLLRTLGLSRARPDAGAAPEIRQPEARRLYEQAMAELRVADALAARRHLEDAVELEPGHPRLLAGLAEALWDLGHAEDAPAQAAAAVAAAAGWEREARLRLRALDLEVRREPARAAAVIRALRARARGEDAAASLDDDLRLARLLTAGGRSEEALELLAALRESGHDDPRLDVAEAEAARRLSLYPRQLDAAQQAIAAAGREEAPFLVLRARHLKSLALRRLGRLDEATVELEEVRNAYGWAGHAKGEADAANDLGSLQAYDQGDLIAAKASFERASKLYDAIGNRRMTARVLINRAHLLVDLGNVDAAIDLYLQALDRFRRLGDTVAELAAWLSLATSYESRGRLEEADEAYASALALLPRVEEPVWQAYALRNAAEFDILRGQLAAAREKVEDAVAIQQQLGEATGTAATDLLSAEIFEHQGELERARELYERALAVYEQSGNQLAWSGALRHLGSLRLKQGDLAGARQAFDRILEIQDPARSQSQAAETRLAVARLAIEEGRLRTAEARAREALEDFRYSQEVLREASAREVLARVLLAARRTAEARREIEAGRALLGGSEVPILRLPLEITAARQLAAGGEEDAARRLLQSLLADAMTGGFVEWDLEIQLAQKEVDLASGRARIAREQLPTLIESARGKGFGLIADKAKRLRGR